MPSLLPELQARLLKDGNTKQVDRAHTQDYRYYIISIEMHKRGVSIVNVCNVVVFCNILRCDITARQLLLVGYSWYLGWLRALTLAGYELSRWTRRQIQYRNYVTFWFISGGCTTEKQMHIFYLSADMANNGLAAATVFRRRVQSKKVFCRRTHSSRPNAKASAISSRFVAKSRH